MVADVDGIDSITGPVLLVMDITRREVEAGQIGSVLERLHHLTDSAKNVHRYRESLIFQVRGYDQDERELPEIPEVRAYFARLVSEWPHFVWFMARGMGGMALLLSLLCQVKVIRGTDGSFGTEFNNVMEVEMCLHDMLLRGAAMYKAFGVSPSDADASALSAFEDLLGN
jgi:hypothetical protein